MSNRSKIKKILFYVIDFALGFIYGVAIPISVLFISVFALDALATPFGDVDPLITALALGVFLYVFVLYHYWKKEKKRFSIILIGLIVGTALLVLSLGVDINPSREKARDSRRIGDLRQIALALELYRMDHDSYPGDADTKTCDDAELMIEALESNKFMTMVPGDPERGKHYSYNTDLETYVLVATLENKKNNALATDPDGTVLGCDCEDPNYCFIP